MGGSGSGFIYGFCDANYKVKKDCKIGEHVILISKIILHKSSFVSNVKRWQLRRLHAFSKYS
jgi:hypothetical protein